MTFAKSLLAAAFALAIGGASSADAQTQRTTTRAAPAPAVMQQAQVAQKCLRALNGACTNPTAVEAVRHRAQVIPAVQVSYLGTPAGSFGGDYIPYERFFQDNPQLFGLPTFIFNGPCCIERSK